LYKDDNLLKYNKTDIKKNKKQSKIQNNQISGMKSEKSIAPTLNNNNKEIELKQEEPLLEKTSETTK